MSCTENTYTFDLHFCNLNVKLINRMSADLKLQVKLQKVYKTDKNKLSSTTIDTCSHTKGSITVLNLIHVFTVTCKSLSYKSSKYTFLTLFKSSRPTLWCIWSTLMSLWWVVGQGFHKGVVGEHDVYITTCFNIAYMSRRSQGWPVQQVCKRGRGRGRNWPQALF